MRINDFITLKFSERYNYTLSEIALKRGVWILRRLDGTISVNVGVNKKLELLVWGTEDHARYNLIGTFSKNTPEFISYEYFLDQVLPKLEENGIKILLSPMQDVRGKIVTPKVFTDYIDDYGKE